MILGASLNLTKALQMNQQCSSHCVQKYLGRNERSEHLHDHVPICRKLKHTTSLAHPVALSCARKQGTQSLYNPSYHALSLHIHLGRVRNDNGQQNIISNVPLYSVNEVSAFAPRALQLESLQLQSFERSAACYKWNNEQNCLQASSQHILESSTS